MSISLVHLEIHLILIFILSLNVYSGGVKFYFPDQSEHDDGIGLELCGRIENLTLLITDNVLNLKAWGFGYHRYDDEYRDGTRFLLDYKAVPGDLTTVIGKVSCKEIFAGSELEGKLR